MHMQFKMWQLLHQELIVDHIVLLISLKSLTSKLSVKVTIKESIGFVGMLLMFNLAIPLMLHPCVVCIYIRKDFSWATITSRNSEFYNPNIFFSVIIDCTAPFIVQFTTNALAQDTKATATDQPQRGLCFVSLEPNYLILWLLIFVNSLMH